jgi:ribose/xylose/arabinose/galactoside ABC-type transport system permease subunit
MVIVLAMIAGFIGGGIWGGIPGFLKAYFNVNEILSTVMMNAIAVQLMNFLLRGPMIDPSQAQLSRSFWRSWFIFCCGAPFWGIAFGLWARTQTPRAMRASTSSAT